MSIPKIQTVLYANAVYCFVSALLIILLRAVLAEQVINLPTEAFLLLGAGLVAFAIDVFCTARRENPSKSKLLYIFVADLAWVAMTPVVMLALQNRITSLGNMLLVDIALIVAAFAAFEWLALKRQIA